MGEKKMMQKSLNIFLAVVFLAGMTGCSSPSSDTGREKSVIDKTTDQVAAKAVRKISTPLNRAKATQRLGEDRLEAMDKALQQQ
jgi:hypothetical protein